MTLSNTSNWRKQSATWRENNAEKIKPLKMGRFDFVKTKNSDYKRNEDSYETFNNKNNKKLSRSKIRCGGLIFNNDFTKIVLVKNKYLETESGERKWGAPKGHIKGREDFVECAEREIWEECGLKIRINRDIPKKQFRNTMYYPIRLEYEYPVKCNDKGEISKAQWVSLDIVEELNINRELRDALTVANIVKYKKMSAEGKCKVFGVHF